MVIEGNGDRREAPKKEPLRVKLGEEFNPFSSVKSERDLPKRETPDVLLVSPPFYLEGIGYGKVVVTTEPNSNLGKNSLLLDLSSDTPRMVELNTALGEINIQIHPFDPTVTTQPDITCIVKIGNIELHSKNENLEDGDNNMEEEALFYDFSMLTSLKPRFLLIEGSLQNLQELTFRFEQNE